MSDNNYYSNKKTLRFILKQFEELKKHQGLKATHDKYPKVKLDGFFIENVLALMYSELSLNPSLGKFETQSIIKESIFKSIEEFDKTVDVDTYINIIQELEGKSLKKENKKFVFYNSLSTVPKSLMDTKFENTWGSFRILKNWPRRISQSQEWKFATASAGFTPPESFHVLKVIVRERNLHDAADKAWNSVDLERGFWNFNLNILREQMFTINNKPFNKVFWGPVHFAEFNDNLEYLYELSYVDSFNNIDSTLAKFRKDYYEKNKQDYSTHFDSNFLGEALIKYSNALDLPQKNFALTKMWELLEYLLCQGKNENFGKLIKRASNLFENKKILEMSLEHIREARNEYIHASNDINPNSPKTLFMLKSIVEMIILFHFNNGDRFIDINEYKDFLNLPDYDSLENEKNRLKRKMSLIDRKQETPKLSSVLIWRN